MNLERIHEIAEGELLGKPPENKCEEREEPCMNLERIREIAENELLGKRSHPWKEPGNKFHHGERVAHCAGEQMRRTGGTVHES